MTTRTTPALLFAGAVLCLLGTLTGCASVESRYAQALEYEAEGRHAEAAWNYIRILRKDRSQKEARTRLRSVGASAIDQQLGAATHAQAVGRYGDAVNELVALGELASAAGEVGVHLSLPSDYRETLAAMQDAAAEALMRLGAEAEADGRWIEAIDAYETALLRYPGPDSRQRELVESQVRVHLAWARQELNAGHGRSAFARAGTALGLLDPRDPLAREARGIQAAAVELSTRHVALFPMIPTENALPHISKAVLDELDDEYLFEHWSTPPDMVVLVDPLVVRRELRREAWDGGPVTDHYAARLGRDLGGDIAVVNQVLHFDVKERVITSSQERARTHGPDREERTYTKEWVELSFYVEIEFELLDTGNAFTLGRGRVSSKVEEKFYRGIYDGDPAELDLFLSEQALFDDELQAEAEWEMIRKLAEEATARLADRTFREIVARIP